MFVAGPLTVNDPVGDAEFGVQTDQCYLERHVEVFQWVETRHQDQKNKTQTIEYKSQWGKHVDSAHFRDKRYANTKPAYGDKTFTSNSVTLGRVWRLSNLAWLAHELGTAYYMPNNTKFMYSAGCDVANPKIGDTRTSWKSLQITKTNVLETISVLGRF